MAKGVEGSRKGKETYGTLGLAREVLRGDEASDGEQGQDGLHFLNILFALE